jgi:hypothetical protein
MADSSLLDSLGVTEVTLPSGKKYYLRNGIKYTSLRASLQLDTFISGLEEKLDQEKLERYENASSAYLEMFPYSGALKEFKPLHKSEALKVLNEASVVLDSFDCEFCFYPKHLLPLPFELIVESLLSAEMHPISKAERKLILSVYYRIFYFVEGLSEVVCLPSEEWVSDIRQSSEIDKVHMILARIKDESRFEYWRVLQTRCSVACSDYMLILSCLQDD